MNDEAASQSFFEHAPGMFCIFDFEGAIRVFNQSFLRLLRYEREELLGKTFDRLVHKEDLVQTERAFKALLHGQGVYEFENRYLCGDNQYRWILWRAYPKVEENLIFCVARETTYENELAPQLSNKTVNTLPALEEISDAFFTVDQDWRFTYLNKEAEKLLLRRKDKLIGRRVWDEFPEATDSVFWRNYRRAMSERKTMAFTAHYDPLQTWFQVMAYPTEEGLSVYVRDATEQVETEQALRYTKERLEEEVAARTAALAELVQQLQEEARERRTAERHLADNEARLANILNTAAESIIVINEEQHITLFNRGAENTFGYSADEIMGRPLNILLPKERAADHHRHVRKFDRDSKKSARRMAGDRDEIQGVRKDGSRFFAEASIAKMRMNGEVSYLAVLRDVTERHHLEQQLRQSLHRSRELSELKSNFITTVSHQFRTPLATISASADVLHLLQENNEFNRPLRRISDNVQRLNLLLDAGLDLVSLSGIDQPQINLQETDFGQLCRRVTADIKDVYHAKTAEQQDQKIIIEETDDIPKIKSDRDITYRLVSNLLHNALAYSEGPIHLELSTIGNEHITLTIRDEGLGIPAEDLPHVTEMFYRGGNVSHVPGLGLGLSFVEAALRMQDGRLHIESEEGIGTRCTIMLPREKDEKQTGTV